MADVYLCKDCMRRFKAFVRDLFRSLAKSSNQTGVHHDACPVIFEQDGSGFVPCTADTEGQQCETPQANKYQSDFPQILTTLCQLIDSSSLDSAEDELQRRDLITPPTHTPTGKELTRTRAPPKITSISPTHKTITLTELPSPLSTHSGGTVHITAHPSVPTSFVTAASSTTSTQSSSASNSTIPHGTDPNYSIKLSTGSKVGIAFSAVLLCVVLWIAVRCCFKHGGNWGHEEDGEDGKRSPSVALESMTAEKQGSPINEIDSRVTAHPPGPMGDGIFELGGDPVAAPSPEVSGAPKFPVTGTEGNNPKGKALLIKAREVSREDS